MKLDKKKKKILYISLFSLDMLLTLFLFILSIIILATMPKDAESLKNTTGMIGYLQKNPNLILGLIVVPLVLLLCVNVYVLVVYVKKHAKESRAELKDLSAEEKAKLKEELMKDLLKEESNEDKKE